MTKAHYPRRSERSAWLSCGLIAGPIFTFLVLIQGSTRESFDFVRIPLSLLALGEAGWLQTANFVLTGALLIAFSIGVQARWPASFSRRWGAVLIAVYGLGLIGAGAFASDPITGFPPGAHQAPSISWHASLHGVAFGIAQLAFTTVSLMFGAVFIRERHFAMGVASLAAGLLTPVLLIGGFSNSAVIGLAFLMTGVLSMGWLALLAAYLIAAPSRSGSTSLSLS